MTLEQYTSEVKNLYLLLENKKQALAEKYCKENYTITIGDIIEDHIGKIQVQSIRYYPADRVNNEPFCVYFGIELKKDGTPKKSGERRNVWHSNLILKK